MHPFSLMFRLKRKTPAKMHLFTLFSSKKRIQHPKFLHFRKLFHDLNDFSGKNCTVVIFLFDTNRHVHRLVFHPILSCIKSYCFSYFSCSPSPWFSSNIAFKSSISCAFSFLSCKKLANIGFKAPPYNFFMNDLVSDRRYSCSLMIG